MTLEQQRIARWLHKATPGEARQLAKHAQTSVAYLRHIAKGRRNATPLLAQRLAAASTQLRAGLQLYQVDLCYVCAHCPLANE